MVKVVLVCVIALGAFLIAAADTGNGGYLMQSDSNESDKINTTTIWTSTEVVPLNATSAKERKEAGNENYFGRNESAETNVTAVWTSTEVVTSRVASAQEGKETDGESVSNSNDFTDEPPTTKRPKSQAGSGRRNKQKNNKKNPARNRNSTTELPKTLEESDELENIKKRSEENDTGDDLGEGRSLKTETCGYPPNIEGVIKPRVGGTGHALGTTINYLCNYGYVSRNSIAHSSVCKINEETGKADWSIPEIACIPRSCGDPGYVVNGHRIGNLFTFPNKVEFQCDDGYKLRGLSARFCQAGGEWSGRLPICERIYCTTPSDPENGRVRYISLEYGTELRYECNEGFMLENHQRRYCTKDGTWSNDQPQCIEARCNAPESPKEGSVRVTGGKVGSFAFFSCNPGKTLLGTSTSKCLITGEWTFAPPQCLSSCYIPDVDNGEMARLERRTTSWRTSNHFVKLPVGESVKHSETLYLRCKKGFSTVAHSARSNDDGLEVTCNDGTWSKGLQCQTTECLGDPPAMANGSPQITSRTHDHTIWYKCDSGYEKKEIGHVTCIFGTWSGKTPTCVDNRCNTKQLNYPGLVRGADEFIQSSHSFTIECEKGYSKRQNMKKSRIICFKGNWDISENPCTEDSCGDEPPNLRNGKPREFTREHGFTVQYECNEGFSIVGSSTVQCRLGKWEGDTPVCEDSAQSVRVISPSQTGDISRNISSSGHSGSSNQPTSHFEHREECGCIYDNTNRYVIASVGDRVLEGRSRVRRGETITFTCENGGMDLVWRNGLRIYEKANFTCSTCQEWQTGDLPSCEFRQAGDSLIVYDDKLKILPGGAAGFVKGELIRIICRNTFGSPTWNIYGRGGIILHSHDSYPSRPRVFSALLDIAHAGEEEHAGKYECYVPASGGYRFRSSVLNLQIIAPEIQCPLLINDRGIFNIIYDNDRKVNSTAIYTCTNRRQRVAGTSIRKCLQNGKWSGSFPTCADIRCPELDEKNIFTITYTNHRRINSVARFYCRDVKKRIEGYRELTCSYNGEWSGTDPTCVDTTCRKFTTVNGLIVSYTNDNKVNSVAHFRCGNSATLVGSSTSTCMHNGVWSNSQPSCEDYVTCDKFAASPGLKVQYSNDVSVGSIAQFFCSPPTTLVGRSYATCRSDGTWSHSVPSCEAPKCSIADLSTSVPEGVVPDMTDVTDEFSPPGSEVGLACEVNLILNGNSKATCGNAGRWQFGNVQCVRGCYLKEDAFSRLIIEPKQDSYRVGQFILLSCPPGMKLSNDVERVMCLSNSWSDIIPDCIEKQN